MSDDSNRWLAERFEELSTIPATERGSRIRELKTTSHPDSVAKLTSMLGEWDSGTLDVARPDADAVMEMLSRPLQQMRGFLPGLATGPFREGELVGGRFEIDRVLGAGGMGVVYLAMDRRMEEPVALKVLREDLRGTETMRRRFEKEVSLARRIAHHNVCRIHEIADEPATPDRPAIAYFTMEYLDGETLADRLARGPLEIPEELPLLQQVAAGLAAAHRLGIVHRDIKPGNVMLTSDAKGPRAVITDFGLVRPAEHSEIPLATRLQTELQQVVGTALYMAPELFEGALPGTSADIYSLGLLMHQALTGELPFADLGEMGMFTKRGREQPPSLRKLREEVPADWDAMIRKALHPQPKERPEAQDFVRVGEPETGTRYVGRLITRTWSASAPRRKWMFGALGVPALLLLGGLFVQGPFSSLVGTWGRGTGLGGNPETAAESKRIVSAYDDYVEAKALLERWDKGTNLDTAVERLEDATKLDATSGLAYALLSNAYRLKYATTQDIAWRDRYWETAMRAVQLSPELAPVQVAMGRVYMAKNELDLAQTSFDKALAIDAHNPDAHLAYARLCENRGRFDDAEAYYRKAVAMEPESWGHRDSLAHFLYVRGRNADAIEEWRRALRIAPDNAFVLLNLAGPLEEAGQLAEAAVMLERSVELRPHYMGYNNIGVVYYKSGRFEDASRAYEKALELEKSDYTIWGNLGDALMQTSNGKARGRETLQKAVTMAEDFRRRNPRDPWVHSDLGGYYARLGERELADTRLKTALSLDRKQASMLISIASSYKQLGDEARAIALVRQALDLGYSQAKLLNHTVLRELQYPSKGPKQN